MGSLEEKIKTIENLPVFPAVLARLISRLGDEEVNLAEIGQIIISDPALSMTIMGIANSSAFGGSHEVKELSQAVNRIGLKALRRIVLGKQSEKLFSSGSQGYGLDADECWEGSLAGAIGAELLAKRTGCCDPNIAFTAGLLRDCGTLIIHQITDGDGVLEALIDSSELSTVERERAAYGFDHTEVGASLGTHWQLPLDLVQAIREHHTPSDESPTALVDCVYCADLLAKQLGYGVGVDGLAYSFQAGPHERLQIDYKATIEIIAEVRTQMNEFQKQFESDQGSQAA